MDLVLWILWGGAVLGVTASGLLPVRPARTARTLARLPQRVGLAAVPSANERIARRLALRLRWSAIGGGLVLAALTALIGAASGWRWSSAVAWTLIGGGMTAAAIGSAVAALHRDHVPDGVRLARARAVTLADYVPAAERFTARALPIGGFTVVVLTVVLEPSRGAVPLVGGTLVAAAVLLFELGSRRVIAVPQPARTAGELAWDDALRSVDLRALALAPMAAGAYAGYAAGWSLDPAGGTTLLLVGALAAVAVAVFSLRALGSTAGRHFLHRLWPETARSLEVAP